MLRGDFDKNDFLFDVATFPKPDPSTYLLPQGRYGALIEKVELRISQRGASMIWFKLRIIGPTHADAVIFDQVVYEHSSDEAIRIGQQKLWRLCKQLGLPGKVNTDDLVGRAVGIRVRTQDDDEYGPKSIVADYV